MDQYLKDATQLYVADKVQPFVDDVLLSDSNYVTRRWHSPQKQGETPVLGKDRPWEHVTYFTYSNYTVRRDPVDRLFKCWYEDLEPLHGEEVVWPTMRCRQLYAYSIDGRAWIKPRLNLFSEEGRATNIVLADERTMFHSMSVVIDPDPPGPDERFRALFTRFGLDDRGRPGGHMQCAHGADGLHWAVYDEKPSFGMCGARLDDVSVIFYDQESRQFVQNTRHFLKGRAGRAGQRLHNFAGQGHRRIWQCRSSDFLHWSEPVLVMDLDEHDNLDENLYGMSQFKVGSMHLATVGVHGQTDNDMHVELAASRDGIRWTRTNKCRPFLAPGGEGCWDAHMVSIVSPPIEVGDELWFFHGGSSCHHDWWLWGPGEGLDHPEARDPRTARFGLGLATLRRDGFAGLFANRTRPGYITTMPLISWGERLVINARCGPGGWIRVAVADHHGKVFEGRSIEQCDVFSGDNISHTVTWSGQTRLPRGGDTGPYWRRLKFHLSDAELFSICFEGGREHYFSLFPKMKGYSAEEAASGWGDA